MTDVFTQTAQTLIAAKGSPHTRRAYTADLDRWLAFCRAAGITPTQPPLLVAAAFRDHLQATLSVASTRRVLSCLSGIYAKLLAQKIVPANPFHPAFLSWPPTSNLGKTVAVTQEDARALIAAAERDPNPELAARDTAILRLLYDTGLRRSSVASIPRAGVVVREEEGAKRMFVRTVAKGAHEVEVPLPAVTARAVLRWLKLSSGNFLFPGTQGHALHVSTINQIVKERAEQAGAEGVHPHCFRAAFVTAAYDAHADEHDIQASVHHHDPKMTRRYDRGKRGSDVADLVARHRGEK